MIGVLSDLVSIRATGESAYADSDGASTFQKAGRALAYAAVIATGSIIGVILSVVVALFTGIIQLC